MCTNSQRSNKSGQPRPFFRLQRTRPKHSRARTSSTTNEYPSTCNTRTPSEGVCNSHSHPSSRHDIRTPQWQHRPPADAVVSIWPSSQVRARLALHDGCKKYWGLFRLVRKKVPSQSHSVGSQIPLLFSFASPTKTPHGLSVVGAHSGNQLPKS